MKNRNNDIVSIFGGFLKLLALAFLLFLLKYVAIAIGTIGLVVGLFYLIKEYFSE